MKTVQTIDSDEVPSILRYPSSLQERYRAFHRDMVDQLERTAALENHWLIFSLLGWENLAACVASHYLLQRAQAPGAARWPLVAVWVCQIVVALLTTKLISGSPHIEDSPL